MLYAFQDRENLYLIMDLMIGGDLRYHIGRQRRFSEEQTSNFRSLFPNFLLSFYEISPSRTLKGQPFFYGPFLNIFSFFLFL